MIDSGIARALAQAQARADLAYALAMRGSEAGVRGTSDAAVASALASAAIPKSIIQAAGDVIYGAGANNPVRLAAGSNGQVLSLVAGVPAWATGPSGSLPTGGTLGQAIVNTGSGTGGWDWFTPNVVFGRRFSYWQIALDTDNGWTVVGHPVPTHFGSATTTSNPLTTRNSIIENTIGISGGTGGWFSGVITRAGFRPRARALVQSSGTLTTRRFGLDFTDSGVSTTAPANAASVINFVRLVYDSSVSANWLLNSGDGTNQSYTDTGLAVVGSTDYYVELDWSVAGTLTSRIYVGSPTAAPTVTNKSSNLSVATANLFFEIYNSNLAGAGTINGWPMSTVLIDSN